MTYKYTSPGTCDANLPGPTLEEACRAPTFMVFLSILEQLVRSNNKISGKCERIKSIEIPEEKYDFVVIGGGGAGAVVAARLSENPHWKILLVEAGLDEPASIQIPMFTSAFSGTAVTWNYTTTNEKYACLSTNRSCPVSMGRVLGGGTGHNGMIYHRGNPGDYDLWAAQGNEGWTWDDVLPYYRLGEDNGEIERVGHKYHGTGGPLSVERHLYLPPIGHSILAAAIEAGYNVTDDLNGDQNEGFTIAQTTTKNGVRCSSATAYLRPIRNRKNLHISLNSVATRVIIENGQAVGIEYYQHNRLKTVRVSREVIVSTGTIGSPQLLLLSGIGSKEHLESVGVKVVKNLPGIGENYQDHLGYSMSFTINETDTFDNDWNIATEYLINQTGPLSGRGLAPLIATLRIKEASFNLPALGLQFTGYVGSCAPGEIGALRSMEKRTLGIRINHLHPKSRGRIRLASNDPFESPIIHGNYFSHPNDVEIVVSGIKMCMALADTKSLRAHQFTLSTTRIEACSNYTFASTKYWACAVRQGGRASDYHPVGTCKMGPSSDPMAVVSPRLKVHGIKRLRVVDASIMPEITSGNTAAPAMMIGERGARFIKEYWDY